MSIQWEFGGGWSNNVLRMITLYSAHNHCLWNCLFRPVYALSLPRTRFVCHPFSFILFLSVFFFFFFVLLIAHPINTAVMSRRNQSGSPYVVCVCESQVCNCINKTDENNGRVIREREILDKHFKGERLLQVNGLKLQNNSCCACRAHMKRTRLRMNIRLH